MEDRIIYAGGAVLVLVVAGIILAMTMGGPEGPGPKTTTTITATQSTSTSIDLAPFKAEAQQRVESCALEYPPKTSYAERLYDGLASGSLRECSPMARMPDLYLCGALAEGKRPYCQRSEQQRCEAIYDLYVGDADPADVDDQDVLDQYYLVKALSEDDPTLCEEISRGSRMERGYRYPCKIVLGAEAAGITAQEYAYENHVALCKDFVCTGVEEQYQELCRDDWVAGIEETPFSEDRLLQGTQEQPQGLPPAAVPA